VHESAIDNMLDLIVPSFKLVSQDIFVSSEPVDSSSSEVHDYCDCIEKMMPCLHVQLNVDEIVIANNYR
jgi:hypothetical protein